MRLLYHNADEAHAHNKHDHRSSLPIGSVSWSILKSMVPVNVAMDWSKRYMSSTVVQGQLYLSNNTDANEAMGTCRDEGNHQSNQERGSHDQTGCGKVALKCRSVVSAHHYIICNTDDRLMCLPQVVVCLSRIAVPRDTG